MAEVEEKIGSDSARARASRQRRERILEAARACFGRHGYAGATVAMIADEAGVSNGLLYQFFRNKEHLLEVVLREVVRDWVRAMVPRPESETTACVALEGMFRRSVEFCRTNPLLPALLSRDRAIQHERLTPVSADRVEPHRQLVASILESGVQSGELRGDLDTVHTADVICQLQADYSGRAYSGNPQHRVTPELIDAAVRFMLDAVRA